MLGVQRYVDAVRRLGDGRWWMVSMGRSKRVAHRHPRTAPRISSIGRARQQLGHQTAATAVRIRSQFLCLWGAGDQPKRRS